MPSRARPKPVLRRHYLKEWREFRKLEQEEAAERIGLSRTQLSKIENMKSPYSQWFLQSAAYVYRCSEADLLTRNPFDDEAMPELFDQLREVPEADRRRLQAIIESYLKTSS